MLVTSKTNAEEKEALSAEEILAPLEGKEGEVRLSPVKQSGMRLASGVLLLIAMVTLILVVGWFVVSLRTPLQSSTMLENSIKLYDTVVGKVLYPILTLIIGYLFGRGGRDAT